MKYLFSFCKKIVIESRKIIFLSLSFTILLFTYFIIWHYTSLILNGSYSVLDISQYFKRLVVDYLILSLVISIIVSILLIVITKEIIKKILIGIVLTLFMCSEIIRMLDWGAIYFGGNHIDNNFWAHAFYADGIVFLVSKQAFVLYLATALFFTLCLFTLKKLSASAKAFKRGDLKKLMLVVVVCNFTIVFIIGFFIFSFTSLGNFISEKSYVNQARSNKLILRDDTTKIIGIDKSILRNDEKFDDALNKIKKKYIKITRSDASIYTKIPESEFFKSLIGYYILSHVLSGKEVFLDDKTVNKYKKDGILLYTLDKKYPFMKKSIYINQQHKTYNKPTIKVGTNIIIIFVESLSRFFLRDNIHGVKNLTPNIKNMEINSYSFTNMNNSAFPTMRGLIAGLGSSIYLLDESIGGTRIPVPCRFLFLSTILKSLDYTTIHIQSSSERFMNIKEFFTKKENYDYFYGSESLAIDNISNLNMGFGVDDSIMFNSVVNWLDQRSSDKPFLLTISTINMHPPYKVTDHYPNSPDNILFNSIYSTDKGFGTLWEYFKKSRYKNNTVLIVTADHAMGNQHEFSIFTKKYKQYVMPFFDNIPFIVYFPGGARGGMVNNTPCWQVDILPTLLDMMNLDMANPFMGLSIFSERPYYKRDENKSGKKVFEFDESKIEEAKMIIGFYLNLYKEDRIIPKDYKVKFNYSVK
jgi:phosphoglycerol transferase MdoB-like AlkP superfamily enzyme